jgi:hypothetical protein
VRKGVVLTSGKLYVLVGTHDPQHGPDRNGESLPCRIMHDFRRGKLMFLPASLQFAFPPASTFFTHSLWLL